MKKTVTLAAILLLTSLGLAWAGPHPHGPFPQQKPSGKAFLHHNPHKPGPGSFRTASHHREK